MSREKQTINTVSNQSTKEEKEIRRLEKRKAKQEKYYMSSQWQLMGRKLVRHKLAVIF
jgi:peptide/nickel transport system permease protein